MTKQAMSPEVTICGNVIQHDNSGVGHNWKNATYIPEGIQDEIAAEIIDGGKDTCEKYVASNGLSYRW